MKKETYKKYNDSPKGQLRLKRFQESKKGQLSLKNASIKYRESDKGKIAKKEYNDSLVGKLSRKKYHKTDKGKKTLRKAWNKYLKTEKGKTMMNKYWSKYLKTEKGRKNQQQKHAKRRNMKYIPILPNIFPEEIPIEEHHIDGKIFSAPLPQKTHDNCCFSHDKIKHIEKANDWVEFFYGIHPIDIIKEF